MSRNAQRGSTTVEFAASAMVMLMVLFGILEAALLLYSYHTVSTAARLASRWAMVRGANCPAASCPATSNSVKAYVLTQLPLLDASKVTVTTTWSSYGTCATPASTGPGEPGCQVAVTVSYPFQLNLAFIPISALTLTSTSKMVVAE